MTLSEYIEGFLDAPGRSAGAFARLAQAFDEGLGQSYGEDFQAFIRHAALSVSPPKPVLVSGPTREEAVEYMKPLEGILSEDPAFPPTTYGWRREDDGPARVCPYRHDPIQLLPAKSRQDVLSEGLRKTDTAYPLLLESESLCPWCRTRYREALARAEGIWQRLEREVVLCPPAAPGEDACAGERLAAMNRSFTCHEAAEPEELAALAAGLRGNDQWPPVVGLVWVPVADKTLASWQKKKRTAPILEDFWILQVSPTIS